MCSQVLDVFAGRAAIFGPERGDGPAPRMPEAPVPQSVARESERATGSEEHGELERLRFENERLRRRIQEELARQAEDRRTRPRALAARRNLSCRPDERGPGRS
jgi:hypothetical protein